MSVLTPPLPETDDVVVLQEAIAAQLRLDPRFARVPVVVEAVGDIERHIETALNGLGAYALVMTPSMPVPYPDLPGPTYDGLRIIVRCGEIPLINRAAAGSGCSSILLAKWAHRRLHRFHPPGFGSVLYAAREGIERVSEVPEGELAYDAHLRLGQS